METSTAAVASTEETHTMEVDTTDNVYHMVKDPVTLTFFFLLMLTIIVSNLVVIIAVKQTEELQTITNAFVVNLAAIDLLIGLHRVILIARMNFPDLTDSSTFCKMLLWVATMLIFSSCTTLLGESNNSCPFCNDHAYVTKVVSEKVVIKYRLFRASSGQ